MSPQAVGILEQATSTDFYQWLSAFLHPTLPLSFLPLIHSVLTGAWIGGSWLGCRVLPAMGAVFYLGAGWPQWKPLDIPGTHLPLKLGKGLMIDTRYMYMYWFYSVTVLCDGDSIAPVQTQCVAAFSSERNFFMCTVKWIFSAVICTHTGQSKESPGQKKESSNSSQSKSAQGHWSPMLCYWKRLHVCSVLWSLV